MKERGSVSRVQQIDILSTEPQGIRKMREEWKGMKFGDGGQGTGDGGQLSDRSEDR